MAGPAAGPAGPACLLIGLDDTDIEGSPGTNQLGRRFVERCAAHGLAVEVLLRHQLLKDPRVPCTTQNGSASVIARARAAGRLDLDALWADLEREVLAFAPVGSDPGLALWAGAAVAEVPAAVIAWGARTQRELVALDEAHAIARTHGVRLAGLGGTGGGAIGALAAIGLAATGEDGRVVHRPGWPWPDPLCGVVTVADALARGLDEVRLDGTNERIERGLVDLGKHLRPAFRGRRVVLVVEPEAAPELRYRALKLP